MRRILIPIAAGLALVAIVFGALQAASSRSLAASAGPQILEEEVLGDTRREISADPGAAPDQPEISFIDSPTAACYQPNPNQDTCYVNWYYMYVDASPSYMVSMTLQLNAIGFVGRYNGFFQTSMYVPYNMHGQGFRVPCGALGAGGHPQFGNAYAYTIRARATDGFGSANYGTLYCPAYTP
jgi:hypothetical protein